MLKNKRILLICKESYSFPFYFLAKELLTENTVASYFFNPPEAFYKKCLLNENTYYKHKEIENLLVFDNNDILATFTENLDNPPIDWEFLDFVEKTYTNDKNLLQQILASQFFSRAFHDRFYFADTTNEQQLYWLELNYRKVIKLLDEFKPDVILDLDTAELTRAVVAEVANVAKLPYIVLEHPRFESFKIPSFSVIWKNEHFYSIFKEKLSQDAGALKQEYAYIENFRNKEKIMSNEFVNDITSKYKRDSLFTIFKYLIGVALYFINLNTTPGNIKLRRKNKIFFMSGFSYTWFYIKMELKKWYLLGRNRYFSDPVKGAKYVYMPLHMIPESSTFVHAPYYTNELFIIEQVAKSLPAGWQLYVKEHQSMVGQRNFSFYKTANSFSNVKMMSMNYHKDPKPWIVHSKGVITITGTSAYEAALLGKKAVTFGNIPFNVIKGIEKIENFENLPAIIASFGEIDNIHSCAAYLATVKAIGSEVSLNDIIFEAEKIISGEEPLTDSFSASILSLKYFFDKALQSVEHLRTQKVNS